MWVNASKCTHICLKLKYQICYQNGLNCICGINTVVPSSMHNSRHCSSACAACKHTDTLANSMGYALLLQPLFAMVVQRVVRPTSMIPGSLKMCIPVGHLLAPYAAPPAALSRNLCSSTVTAQCKSSRIITRLKLHAQKGANHFCLSLI